MNDHCQRAIDVSSSTTVAKYFDTTDFFIRVLTMFQRCIVSTCDRCIYIHISEERADSENGGERAH